MLKRIRTPVLEIGYEETGTPDGTPVVLLHGFPYDVRAYDAVAARLAERCRVLVPYLRGYGPTRFLSAETMRSGQQAALGTDLLGFLDALWNWNAANFTTDYYDSELQLLPLIVASGNWWNP